MIIIRDYQPGDGQVLRELYFSTVHNINSRDYTRDQLQAWAPDEYDEAAWDTHLQALTPFVAVIDNKVVGYADLQSDGLIDHFFCHHQYQGQGIGRALMQHILEQARQRSVLSLRAYVSITARPFFEHAGFQVVKEQQVRLRGQLLTNYRMEMEIE